MRPGRFERLRQSTAARFIALYLALNLVAAVPVFAYIYQSTDRLVLKEFREIVDDQTALLQAEYRRGGLPRVARAIDERIDSGSAAHGAYLLVDPAGATLAGNLKAWPPTLHASTWSEMLLYRQGHERPERIGLTARRLPSGHRLLVGWVMDDRRRLREALATALAGALLLSIPLGLLGSAVLLQFMNRRVRGIASIAARVAAGDLDNRIAVHGTSDPFDQLGAALNAMLERLERLVAELRIVTDGLAHDLRSPLTRMRASVERGLAEESPAGREHALEAVSRDFEGMLRMLTGTLEVSRAEAGIGRESFDSFDIAALARDLCEMYQPLAEERGVTMDVHAPNGVSYFGNRELLGQAVSNLIDNSLKYGASGGSIDLELERTGDCLRFSVSDHGSGIIPEQREEALLKFRRLDAARTTEGSGLGLALARAVARLHGGEVLLEDNAPGLRAVLTLPC